MKVSELRSLWEGRRASLRKLAEGVPEGREDCRAAPGVMSLADHILHVLSAEKTAIDALTTTTGVWEWQTGIDSAAYPERKDILSILDAQTARGREYFAKLTDEELAARVKLPWGDEPSLEGFWVQWFMHDSHHVGSIVATMRAGGIEPPNLWG